MQTDTHPARIPSRSLVWAPWALQWRLAWRACSPFTVLDIAENCLQLAAQGDVLFAANGVAEVLAPGPVVILTNTFCTEAIPATVEQLAGWARPRQRRRTAYHRGRDASGAWSGLPLG